MNPSIIHRIPLGIVNAYLIQTQKGAVLIDTGYRSSQKKLESELDRLGFRNDRLKLIILTHGDADHIGNAAYVRSLTHAPIAMGKGDVLMARSNDESESRKVKPDHLSWLFTLVKKTGMMNSSGTVEGFEPDLFLQEGQSLSPYDLNATVLALPGHSKGSIGILTEEGDLFCGDLIYRLPGFGYIDDAIEHAQSMARVKALRPKLVYPGHGKPFVLK